MNSLTKPTLYDNGKHMQKYPVITEIYDEKLLPYPKESILDALCFAIENTDSDQLVEALKTSAISLANKEANRALQNSTCNWLVHFIPMVLIMGVRWLAEKYSLGLPAWTNNMGWYTED